MIRLEIIGYLGTDAIVNEVNGKTVINFSVAHTDKWTNANGEQKERTMWVNCEFWVKSVGIASYLKKGTQVYVTGRPEVKIYQPASGETLAQQRLVVSEVKLLGVKN